MSNNSADASDNTKEAPLLGDILNSGINIPREVNGLNVPLREWTNGEFGFYESLLDSLGVNETLIEYTDHAREAHETVENHKAAVGIMGNQLNAHQLVLQKRESMMLDPEAGPEAVDNYLAQMDIVAEATQKLMDARNNLNAQVIKVMGTNFVGTDIEDDVAKAALVMCYLLGNEIPFKQWTSEVTFDEEGTLTSKPIIEYIEGGHADDNTKALEVVEVGKGSRRRQVTDLISQMAQRLSDPDGMITSIM